ncbi:integrase catalytic domain-containing protein [Trichonephila clavipes]|nr:integrase catalytic domain-containing protein [Trichonephila clavipes]
MSNCLGIKKEKIKTPVSGLNGLSQNIKWKLKTIISNEDSSFAEPVDFFIVDKITEFTPSSCLDISNVEIPKFLTLADKSFYEENEVHALISADIFFKVLKQNTYKVNEELFFKESEFGWISCGKLEERQTNEQGHCFLVNNDSIQDTLKLFFDLEGLGILDDPVLHERDQALEIFQETVEFEKGRYIVQLPFRKSYNELSDNYPLPKQRFQNLWRRFGHDSELYQQYREIIHDYTEQGIIEEVKTEITDNKLKRPVYYLPHLAIKKDGRLTSKTRIVFDAGTFCSDIKEAFLQICLADEHKDAIRFLWSDDEPCAHKRPELQTRLPRLELLGALVAARLASKGNKTQWKLFVANRVNEITSLTDPHSWYNCAGKENPADFLFRGLSADCLVSNSRWWTGAEFLSDSEFPKNFQQVVPELDYLTEHEKETVAQERKKLPEADRSEETVLLNSDSSSILDELLELSNNYFKVINILSYIFSDSTTTVGISPKRLDL